MMPDSIYLHMEGPWKITLLKQTKRAVLQAGHIWGQGKSVKIPMMPNPNNWGWLGDGSEQKPYVPLWTLHPKASSVCRELVQCGCLKG